MIYLGNDYYALDYEKCPDDLGYIKLEDISEDTTATCAIKVEFKNDVDSNVEIIKKVLMVVIPVTIIFVATIIIFYKLFNN